MAKKQCPVCGKAVAAQAQYCIYCSAKFDEIPQTQVNEEAPAPSSPKSALGLIVTLISLVLIAIVLLLVFLGPSSPLSTEPTEETTTTVVTTTTRNAARDEWRQTFVGYWYDETSAGKKDLKKQGGYVLYIEDVFRDFVTFDLLSYEGGEGGKIASASIKKAVIDDDTLHFTFADDTLGHAGEGFMRFTDDGIQMEVRIDAAESLPEEEHTLAAYAVFKRRALPQSEGQDLSALTNLNEVKAVAGKQTADPKKDAKGNTTYTFGCLKALVNKDKALVRLTVDCSKEENKAKYRYDAVDGTMSYDTIKTYFGEALHDYVEQPTDIRVLHYVFEDGKSVTFTFDADNNLLTKIKYDL